MADTSLMMIPPTMTGVILFAPGKADEVLAEIKEKARAEAAKLDISTKEKREALAALAYKIARTKTATDKMRLELVADRKKELRAIDLEGARIWNELEALQKEVRQPLTEWENRDKDRIAKHEAAIVDLDLSGTQTLQQWQTMPLEAMRACLLHFTQRFPANYDWEEFGSRGSLAVRTATDKITEAIQKRQAYDAEQIELARLRAEAAERAQREREEAAAAKAKAEAEEKARREAEEAERKAKAEQERILRESQEREAKAQREAAEREAAIERERAAAQERAEQAERQRIEAEAKAKRDAEAAAKKAEQEKQAAIRAEQERAERERKAEEEAERKRAANRAHAAKINNEAKACLLNHTNLTAENAEEVIKAIAKGLVSHVSIQY
jgi:hypothetical protein